MATDYYSLYVLRAVKPSGLMLASLKLGQKRNIMFEIPSEIFFEFLPRLSHAILLCLQTFLFVGSSGQSLSAVQRREQRNVWPSSGG